jgi:hypothetical protein
MSKLFKLPEPSLSPELDRRLTFLKVIFSVLNAIVDQVDEFGGSEAVLPSLVLLIKDAQRQICNITPLLVQKYLIACKETRQMECDNSAPFWVCATYNNYACKIIFLLTTSYKVRDALCNARKLSDEQVSSWEDLCSSLKEASNALIEVDTYAINGGFKKTK